MGIKKIRRKFDSEAKKSKIEVILPPRPPKFQNSDTNYWNKFKFVAGHKHDGPIEAIEVCQSEPHDYLSVASTKITIFDSATNTEKRAITKISDVVHTAAFRVDGRLIAAAGESKVVEVFDSFSRNSLRSFKGHTGAIKVVKWSAANTELLSAGNDRTIRLWDLPTESEKVSIVAHDDYVTCVSINPTNPDLWFSGAYDHRVKLWDMRAQKAVMEWDMGEPVQSLVCFPSGSAIAVAAGCGLKVWDCLSGSGGGNSGGAQPLAVALNHQKAVTCLAFDGRQSRLLSGSIDQHVKVYDVSDYSVTHSMRYASPIVCLAVSPVNSHVIVGMTDGVLSVRQRPINESDSDDDKLLAPASVFRFDSETAAAAKVAKLKKSKSWLTTIAPKGYDQVVVWDRKVKLRKFEIFLRKFDYRRALDAALKENNVSVVVACLNALIDHEAVSLAISGRNDEQLLPLLHFLANNLSDSVWCSMFVDVVHVVLDLYARVIGQSESVKELLKRIQNKIALELSTVRQLMCLAGSLELLIAGSSTDGSLPMLDSE